MQNTLFTNDNLFVLSGLNSELVDLIYLDPPFNSKRTYSAPIGSKAAGASFKDMWTWQDVNEGYLDKLVEDYPFLVKFIQSIEGIHGKVMMAYIAYMTQRIIEMHRILKSTGSFYLHCDPTASHYLKIVCDEVFGRDNFRNEIIWCYSHGGKSKSNFARKHDVIFRYSKSKEFIFNGGEVGIKRDTGTKSKGGKLGFDETGRAYQDKIVRKTGKIYRYYLDEGKIPEDYWIDINSLQASDAERTGYPTQKPLKLLERIIKASSNEGDVVLDPFCGCATTCVASEHLRRKWIGIDIEEKATEVLIDRLTDAQGSLFKNFIHRKDIPQRSDIAIEPISKSIKERLFTEQGSRCKACNTEMRMVDFEVDHIIPKSKGGGDYYENYQLLCSNCNRIKGNRPMEYLRVKIKKREELMQTKITFGG